MTLTVPTAGRMPQTSHIFVDMGTSSKEQKDANSPAQPSLTDERCEYDVWVLKATEEALFQASRQSPLGLFS